jgi:hypothetical protein
MPMLVHCKYHFTETPLAREDNSTEFFKDSIINPHGLAA